MSWQEWLALAVVAVGSFGVGGWIAALLSNRHASREAEKQRDHVTTEARTSRRFEIRLEAYKAASQFLARQEIFVRWTEPVWGPMPDPPEWTPEDSVDFGGTISVTASDEVREAMQAAWMRSSSSSRLSASTARANRPTAPHDPSTNPGLVMHEAPRGRYRRDRTGSDRHARRAQGPLIRGMPIGMPDMSMTGSYVRVRLAQLSQIGSAVRMQMGPPGLEPGTNRL
jgi:hypothetical protein